MSGYLGYHESQYLHPAEAPQGVITKGATRVEKNENGLEVWFEGSKYPQRGLVQVPILEAVNHLKKEAMIAAKVILKSNLRLFVPFVGRGVAGQFLNEFGHNAYALTRIYWAKPDVYSKATREIQRVALTICETERHEWVVQATAMALEQDKAYRWRLQDILGSLNKKNLERNSAKEISRLAGLLAERDQARDWRWAKRGIYLGLLLNPKIKNTIYKFLKEIDIDKIKLDTADLYWFLKNENGPEDVGYNVLGLSRSAREKFWETL